MLEIGLKALLAADATISNLVGNRIMPMTALPLDSPVYPYITYLVVPSAHSEYSFEAAELRMKTIQFDVWADSALTGKTILIAIRNVLSGYAGTLSDGTRVLFAERGNELDNFDTTQKEFRSVCDYDFTFSEP